MNILLSVCNLILALVTARYCNAFAILDNAEFPWADVNLTQRASTLTSFARRDRPAPLMPNGPTFNFFQSDEVERDAKVAFFDAFDVAFA